MMLTELKQIEANAHRLGNIDTYELAKILVDPLIRLDVDDTEYLDEIVVEL